MALKLTKRPTEFQDPPVAKFLFGSPKMALPFLALRLYVGYSWIEGAEHKITDPKWTVTGEALKAFWLNAAKIPAAPAKPPITFDWYRSFLQFLIDTNSYVWFGKLIAFGELLVGIGLIVGLFTGIAAFFGGLMNFNFMLAGSASTNPLLFACAAVLMLGWKVAGYYGLDRVALPLLGTPWQLGALIKHEPEPVVGTGVLRTA